MKYPLAEPMGYTITGMGEPMAAPMGSGMDFLVGKPMGFPGGFVVGFAMDPPMDNVNTAQQYEVYGIHHGKYHGCPHG